jgi:hypothetical protein
MPTFRGVGEPRRHRDLLAQAQGQYRRSRELAKRWMRPILQAEIFGVAPGGGAEHKQAQYL